MNNEPVAWMPVIGFEENYEVSNAGDIRNIQTGKILAKNTMGAGYYKADLWQNGKRKQTSIHRVVAESFLGFPDCAMEVNHKDGNKLNNHVSNLEWVTRSENEQHSREVLGNLCKPVKAICLKTGEVRIYPSQTATARDGFEPKCVSDICLKKDRYTHKGWAFEYYTHPAQELNDGGEPVKNATYWKRQYNEMSALNDRLKSSLYHANEQIKYLEFHPSKTLTDEEIRYCRLFAWRTADELHPNQSHTEERQKTYDREFSKAILRKAQE